MTLDLTTKHEKNPPVSVSENKSKPDKKFLKKWMTHEILELTEDRQF